LPSVPSCGRIRSGPHSGTGTRIDLQEVFELHAAGKTHVVYERRQLEDVNTAIHEVETGQVKARLVFDLQ
jgi:alcohol dehydrogenase, propanol-preferring